MTERVDVAGVCVDPLTMEETVRRFHDAIRARKQIIQVSVNAAKTVAARRNANLRRALENATIANADGQSVVWAARILGHRLPERVAGIDLMHTLLRTAPAGLRVFVLGAREDVLATAISRLGAEYPHVSFEGSHHGYFDVKESPALCRWISDVRPDVLFVAMSTPMKELWIEEHRHELDVPVLMGVGGAMDVAAGKTARAPRALQRAGLEWAFRLAQEPRRLWRRYLLTNAEYMWLVALASLRGERVA